MNKLIIQVSKFIINLRHLEVKHKGMYCFYVIVNLNIFGGFIDSENNCSLVCHYHFCRTSRFVFHFSIVIFML